MVIKQASIDNQVQIIIDFCVKNNIHVNGELVNGNWLSGEIGLWRKKRLHYAINCLLRLIYSEQIMNLYKVHDIKFILGKLNDRTVNLFEFRKVVTSIKDGKDLGIRSHIADNTDGTYEIKFN